MAEKDSVIIKKRLSETLPEYKFSVTRNDFAGGHSVNVRVLSGPIEVFAKDNDRDRANGYIEIWRDKYKEDERINDAIKPDIDKMYKIIYDIGQFPSGYHGGPYLHWNFGSYSKPYEVTASKKSKPAPMPEKSSGETNADSELLMTFSQGWSLYKTTINKKDYDGKPITLVVYNLNKNKDLKNIPYDKFLEFKGEMLTSLNMKWGKFQKFEKWTFPPDTDVLKVIIDKYYGVGESKEETPTPQPTPATKDSKMSVKEIADRLMTLDSTLGDRLKIESGSQLYADDDLQKKYIKYWTDYYEGDTSIPTKMKELSMTERNELGDYFEDDNYHSLKNLFMLYGYFGMDNKKNAEEYYKKSGYGLNPKNFKPEEKKEKEFNIGDVYLDKLSGGKLEIREVGLKELLVHIQIGNYLDTYNKVYARLMIERGDWIKVLDEEKEELPFKEGDKFLLTINSGDTTLTILDIDEASVKVKYADGSIGMFELDTAKSRVERKFWKKVLDEEKEGGSEEEIKKAIAALEILAEDGDEDARKGIEALKILLN
jgi:hypothetical protein